MLRHPARFIAFGGGAGLAPVAPGTFGTLLALPLYWLIHPRLSPFEYLLLIAVLFALGVWACDVTGRALGVADHGGMVWDEVVAFLLVLFFIPQGPFWQAAAFPQTRPAARAALPARPVRARAALTRTRLRGVLRPPPPAWRDRSHP